MVNKPARVVAATSVNFAKSIRTDRAAGAFANDQVELEIFHRRIEHFFHLRVKTVNFVNKQHIALFQIGEQRRQIARL